MAASLDKNNRPLGITDLPMGPGAGQVPPSDQCHPLSWFQSGDIVGNGMAQSTPHGLGRAPNMVLAWPVAGNNGMGAAGTQFTNVTQGTATTTNVVVTATSGGSYRAYAI